MKKGNIVGVISAKGGVGKTTIVANLGVALVSEFGKKVLAVDGNITAPNLGLYLDIVRPPVTLHDVLKNQISITQSIYVHKTGLHVIPGSLGTVEQVNLENLREEIRKVSNRYDFVLIDSAPGLNEEVLAVVNTSDNLLIVTNPSFPTVTTTFKSIKLAKERWVPITGIVLNRVQGKYELGERDVADALDISNLAVIPEDINVAKAVSQGMTVVDYSPKSPASKEFIKLAADLSGGEYLEGFFSKTKKLFEYWRKIFFGKKERTAWKAREVMPVEEEQEPRVLPEIRRIDPTVSLNTRKKVFENALQELRRNYEEGLLDKSLYEELKGRYEDELKKIDAEIESMRGVLLSQHRL